MKREAKSDHRLNFLQYKSTINIKFCITCWNVKYKENYSNLQYFYQHNKNVYKTSCCFYKHYTVYTEKPLIKSVF